MGTTVKLKRLVRKARKAKTYGTFEREIMGHLKWYRVLGEWKTKQDIRTFYETYTK